MELYRMQKRESFGFSAENPTGQKSGGTKGKTAKSCVRVSRLHREKLLRCVIQMVLA